jgi:lipoyl(octanoyl) transferase
MTVMKSYVEVAMASLYRRRGTELEFLIIRRVPEDGGFWQPVTGTMEPGESSLETAIREIAEETGITELLHISEHIHQNEWESDDHSGRDFVHAVEVPLHAKVILSHEHDDHKWLSLEEAVMRLKFNGNKESLRRVHEYAVHSVQN